MKEAYRGLNISGDEIPRVCNVIGYFILPSDDIPIHLIRHLDTQRKFPRFHLEIGLENDQISTSLHLDKRFHRGGSIGIPVSEELERLIKDLEAEIAPSDFMLQLLVSLKHQVFFGLGKQ